MFRRQQSRRPFDKAAHHLKEALAIDSTHPLYSLLHEAARLALRGKLPINVDTLAFEIARTPALLKQWTQLHQEDEIAVKINESITECESSRRSSVSLARARLSALLPNNSTA